MNEFDLPLRLSRLRRNPNSRALVRETKLSIDQFIYPLFINETINQPKTINSMPGLFQLDFDSLTKEIETISALGIPAVLLFGIPKKKDACGSESFNPNGVIQQAIKRIRSVNSDLVIISDICFCEYTDHGHCGILSGQQLNIDQTLIYLGKQAISHAEAGADWLAPSGMIDGMVLAMRQALDSQGFSQIPILSYSAKYASCLYGPFRNATEGAPQFGDRKSYQMDPANRIEAVRECQLDIEEGADMIMVKPASFYLDVIHQVKQTFSDIPLGAYQVSGEYAMIKVGAQNQLFNEEQAMLESILSIKRAGADFIISYFAKDLAKVLR